MSSTELIDDYVRVLDRRLTGPRRLKRDLLTEARDGLHDAAEAYREAGLDQGAASRRAISDFGTPNRVVPAYQTELVIGAARRVAVVAVAIPVAGLLFGDKMWQGGPWSGLRPPEYYSLLSQTMDWLKYVLIAVAAVGLLVLRRRSRHGDDPRVVSRMLGMGALVALTLTSVLGGALYVATLFLWPHALTWPPMVMGGVAMVAVATWQAVVSVRCLRAVAGLRIA